MQGVRYSPFGLFSTLSWLSLSFLNFVRAAPTDLPSAASFYVSFLPDLHQDPEHPLHIFAGHIPSDPNAPLLPSNTVFAHLHFVLVKSRRLADKERILFWFNGGPGCSSFDGLMMEMGPFRADRNGGLRTIDGGWEEYTNMVFVDQPAGTGYSYTSTDRFVHELSDAANQVIEFMRNFYEIFPEYESMDTFIGGESYAGQYIPYIGSAILSSNLHTRLKGIAIGNGWIDARNQYISYLDYSVKHGLIEENTDAWKQVKQETDNCVATLSRSTHVEPITVADCENILTTVSNLHSKKEGEKEICMNVYDVRLYDEACGANWPPDLPDVTAYLGRKDVKHALHADAKAESWVECNGRIGRELVNRESSSAITLLPELIEKVPVMLYAGDQDFICNYMGIESMIRDMEWNGQKGLGTVETQTWSVDDVPVGTWVESRNLTYVKIFNSSHMVPYDVPLVAHDMILRFMGVNFSAIMDGTARIPSKVGNDEKPLYTVVEGENNTDGLIPVAPGKTPEQDKAMWEAYYNAGSAALVLILIALAIGAILFWRGRRRSGKVPIISAEEVIPLSQSHGDFDHNVPDSLGDFKGKGRAKDSEPMFEVGEGSEDGEGYHDDAEINRHESL